MGTNTEGSELLYLKAGVIKQKYFFVLYVPVLTRLQQVLSNPFLTLKEQRRAQRYLYF